MSLALKGLKGASKTVHGHPIPKDGDLFVFVDLDDSIVFP